MSCQEIKESIGQQRHRITCSCRTCHPGSSISKDNSNKEKEDTFTGNSLWSATDLDDWLGFDQPLAQESTLLSQDLTPMMPMFGRMTPPFKEQDSNLESSPSVGTPRSTGIVSGVQRCLDALKTSPLPSLWDITGVSERLLPTLLSRYLWKGQLTSFGAAQVPVNRGGLGPKLEWTLTLKTHELNSGAATEIIDMLWLMNFEVESMYLTSYDGVTVIRCKLNLKEVAHPWSQQQFGSPLMSTPGNGTRGWMNSP